jgi:Rap guanine nucleotide exchange factor 1
LTFVHLGNPEYLTHEKTKNLLNFGKRWQQYAILDNVRRFSRWSYDIERDDKIISLFNDFNALSEEDGWERSYQIEPRI